MSYYFTKTTSLGYEQALVRVQEELKKEGFGINPLESMKAVANPQLARIGSEVAAKLQSVVARI